MRLFEWDHSDLQDFWDLGSKWSHWNKFIIRADWLIQIKKLKHLPYNQCSGSHDCAFSLPCCIIPSDGEDEHPSETNGMLFFIIALFERCKLLKRGTPWRKSCWCFDYELVLLHPRSTWNISTTMASNRRRYLPCWLGFNKASLHVKFSVCWHEGVHCIDNSFNEDVLEERVRQMLHRQGFSPVNAASMLDDALLAW